MQTATLPELAREKNVTRQALEAFRNSNAIKPAGKKGKADTYYKSDFANYGRSKKTKSEWQLLWEKERALKLQIENKKKRGELLDRGLTDQVFGKIYATQRAIFLNIGPSLSDIIAAEAGVTEAEVKINIERIITKECYQALATIKKDINRFLKSAGAPEIAEEEAPPEKPKARKPARRKTS
jgi:hypothetical protein